jgi:ABC-type transporter Mla subunit MlaD
MAEYKRAEIVTGLFIAASVAVFALFAFKVQGLPIWLFEDEGVDCEAWFSDVKGMDTAAKVTIAGYRVGTVTGITEEDAPFDAEELAEESERRKLPEGWRLGREHHRVRVRFKIIDRNVRLGDDARISVMQDGFIEPYHLSIDPGTWPADQKALCVYDRPDRPIKVVSERADSVLDSLKPIAKQAETLIARINNELLGPLLDGNRESLAKLIPELSNAVGDAGKAVHQLQVILDPKSPDSPILRANKLLEDVDKAVVDLKTELTRDVLGPLNAALKDGKEAVEAAKKALDEATAVIVDAKPKVADMLGNLRDETARLDKRLTEVQTSLKRLLDDVDHLATLQQSELAAIMESFKQTAWEIELAARKVRANPAVLIFGDDEKQRLESDPRDDSGLRKSGRVKPYDQRDESPTKKD